MTFILYYLDIYSIKIKENKFYFNKLALEKERINDEMN